MTTIGWKRGVPPDPLESGAPAELERLVFEGERGVESTNSHIENARSSPNGEPPDMAEDERERQRPSGNGGGGTALAFCDGALGAAAATAFALAVATAVATAAAAAAAGGGGGGASP